MQNPPLRTCRECGKQALSTTDLDLFRAAKAMRFGKANHCKECDNNRVKAKKAVDPDAYLQYKRDAHFKSRYGVTQRGRAVYVSIVGKCEICDCEVTPETAHVDHSHAKGHVRGVLCNACNTGIGKFKDSPETLYRAAEYLIEREQLNTSHIAVVLDALYHANQDAADKIGRRIKEVNFV